MRVLITRPLEDARDTAAKLEALGREGLIAPLFEIRYRDGAEIALDGVEAVLVTSANGIRGLARRTARRDVPVYAVGAHSAAVARALGFGNVESADGDAPALAALVAQKLSPDKGSLFHPCGADSSENFQALDAFYIRREVLYDSAEVEPPGFADAVRAAEAALFFSPRGARVFRERAVAARLNAECGHVAAVCISRPAAAALAPLRFCDVRIAARPNQAAMLDLL